LNIVLFLSSFIFFVAISIIVGRLCSISAAEQQLTGRQRHSVLESGHRGGSIFPSCALAFDWLTLRRTHFFLFFGVEQLICFHILPLISNAKKPRPKRTFSMKCFASGGCGE